MVGSMGWGAWAGQGVEDERVGSSYNTCSSI